MPTNQLSQSLERAWKCEQLLGDAFFLIADRDDECYELQRGCTLFGHWSFGHATNLEEFLVEQGGSLTPEPVAVHAAHSPAMPAGNGLQPDLQALLLRAQETRAAWAAVAEAAQEFGDDKLGAMTTRCTAELDQQIMWLNNQLNSFTIQDGARNVLFAH